MKMPIYTFSNQEEKERVIIQYICIPASQRTSYVFMRIKVPAAGFTSAVIELGEMSNIPAGNIEEFVRAISLWHLSSQLDTDSISLQITQDTTGDLFPEIDKAAITNVLASGSREAPEAS